MMDSLRDAQDQTTEIVSTSLIKMPPSDVYWNDYENFDLGSDVEGQWQQYTENGWPKPVPLEVE